MNTIKDKKYLVLSDIHFGHRSTKTADIIEQLYAWLKKHHEKVIDLDAIFIAGDLFDSQLEWNGTAAIEASIFMNNFAKFCKKYNIALRLLEGTPSHDYRQGKAISANITSLDIDIDYKYIDTLSIEYMTCLDMHVLYVPDEWRPDPETTYKEVLILLKKAGIDKVDIAIMHGNFMHQLPKGLDIPHHDAEKYLQIVKHWINIGHIHIHSVYDRIVAQGSFSRLSHGEEDPKGACFMYVSKENYFEFKENLSANIYKTVKVRSKEMSDIFKKLDKVVVGLSTDSNLRIIVPKTSPLLTNVKDVMLRYPLINIKVMKEKEDVIEHFLETSDIQVAASTISISPTNIGVLLRDLCGDELIGLESVYDEIMCEVI